MSPKPSSSSTFTFTKQLLVWSVVLVVVLCTLFMATAARHVTAPTISTPVVLTTLTERLVPPPPVLTRAKKVNLQGTVISFTGDVMLGRQVEEFITLYGVDYPTRSRGDYFASSSAVVVNFESAMAMPHQKTPNGGMRFSVAVPSLDVLESIGVTHASLANNHSLDYGTVGYQGAIAALGNVGITTFGHATRVSSSSITFIPHGTSSIAIIGISTLFSTPSLSDLTNIFATAVASSTQQIVYIHWGNEYELMHSATQESFAKKLVAAGADLIIGHHPHVTQDIGIIDGVPVLYSLGNFIFDQYFSSAVQTGYSVDVYLTSTSTQLKLRPHTRAERAQPRAMTASESAVFFAALAGRSNATLTDQIKAGIIAF
jgi:gamma-polyglutamate biosynthesis protein CapA